MTDKYYIIHDLSKGLDGLYVRGDDFDAGFVVIKELINLNAIIGDRNVKWPIGEELMFMSKKCLTQVEDPEKREFAHDNPYGKFLYEAHHTKGIIEVAVGHYDKKVTVSIIEHHTDEKKNKTTKTVFTHAFEIASTGRIDECIDDAFSLTGDVEDVVFAFEELRDAEAND